ncbi:MAG TPA: hypothetical protein VGK20_01155 [Candidatus Binatia bacterium]|jgi:hypothetical protein
MRIQQRLFLLATICALAAVPVPAVALNSAEVGCRDAVARAASSYEAAVSKVIIACHVRQSLGERPIGDDCNSVAVADSSDTLATLRSDVTNAITTACTFSKDLLSEYSACPPPAATADDGGATHGIDNFDEVAQCILSLAEVHGGKVASDAEGQPTERLLAPLLKCQGKIGKGTSNIVRTRLQELRRCQNTRDQTDTSPAYDCNSSDPRGRIAKADQKFLAKVGAACNFSSEVLSKLHACGNDEASLLACSKLSADQHGSALSRDSYVMDGSANTTTTLPVTTTTTVSPTTTLPGNSCGSTFPQCDGACPNGTQCMSNGSECSCHAPGTGGCAPATIHRLIHAKYGTVAGSKTSLSTGWSGQADDVDIPDFSNDTINVTCDDQCQNCAITLNTNTASPASNCRCTSDSTKTCSVIDGSDPAHCGTSDPTCRCYFGAPLALSSGGTPACVVNRIRSNYSGTMNLRTGEWHDHLSLASIVYLGSSTTAPCPTCNGDPVPNDGIRGGTCSGLGGGACDVNGVHATFGPTSWDCLPSSTSNISGAGLLIDLKSSTGAQSVTAQLPCDTPGGANCPCRVCSGNGNQGCFSDADCAATGAGTCTAGGGAGVDENECDGFLCDAATNGEPVGRCHTGPVDMYCDGKTHPDGRGYIPCTQASDCSANSAGTCSILDTRRCFPNPILADGQADALTPTSSAIFCIAPTSNPAVNLAAGLPGPGKIVLDFTSDIRCQSNESIAYQFPDGANCNNSGVTTTTTMPLLQNCADSAAPVCGGQCPLGEACANSSGVCACTGVPQCSEASAPICGGLCPTGEVCTNVGSTCECGSPGAPTCGSAIAPVCGGTCDVGSVCVASGSSCACQSLGLPTCSQATAPGCAGTCSLGSLCEASGNACICSVLPIPAVP